MISTKFSEWKHSTIINLAAKDRFKKVVAMETVIVSGFNQRHDNMKAYFICLKMKT